LGEKQKEQHQAISFQLNSSEKQKEPVATILGVNLGVKQIEQHEATILGVDLSEKQKGTTCSNNFGGQFG